MYLTGFSLTIDYWNTISKLSFFWNNNVTSITLCGNDTNKMTDLVLLRLTSYISYVSNRDTVFERYLTTNSLVQIHTFHENCTYFKDGKFIRNQPLTENVQNSVGSYEYTWISLLVKYVWITMRLHFLHIFLYHRLIRKTPNKIVSLLVIFTMIFSLCPSHIPWLITLILTSILFLTLV